MHERDHKYFVIIDRDRKLFNVFESGNDIGVWNRKVEAAQNAGARRDVIGYPSNKDEDTLKEDQKQLGNTYTKDSVLLPYE